MKPFDLERAKAGAKLVTRDGRAVNAFAFVADVLTDYPCVAHIEGEGWLTHSKEGRLYACSPPECDDDLFMAPETRTIYLNVFANGSSDWYETEAAARSGLNARALKIAVPVTFEV
jgi:hypothetical protein